MRQDITDKDEAQTGERRNKSWSASTSVSPIFCANQARLAGAMPANLFRESPELAL